MVEKGLNFIFCLGTTYDISNMESIGNYSIVFVDKKSMPPKMFYLYLFCFELWHLYKSLLPSTKDLSLTLCNFYFYLSLHLKGRYDHIWALGVANMQVCFMNGPVNEHNGLGITCFSIDIWKDMVACWYAWVLKSSCRN